MATDFDYVLVGGGLQNGLIALALRARDPAIRIAMIERGEALGGNHTWCFHAGDVDELPWLEPLVAVRWPGYAVAFPDVQRELDEPYACVTSSRFADQVARALAVPGSARMVRTEAVRVGANEVVIRGADGVDGVDGVDGRGERTLTARAVIDARGPDRATVARTGWQKFVGQEVVLASPHGQSRPMLIDACLEQRDGFRFMYVLPLAPDRLLIEDTTFSDGPELEDDDERRAAISAYAVAHGWQITEIAREERGVLPLPLAYTPPARTAPLVAGYGGGWFHPVTGYSFPVAARLAQLIARLSPELLFGDELAAHAREHDRQVRFALRLNRMLFRWFRADQRFRVLERFYRLPTPVIRRFYALQLTGFDRIRIVAGRPPRGLSLRAAFAREAV